MKNLDILLFICFFILISTLYACEKKEVPIIETTAVTNILANSAKCGGNIISEGSSPVITSGICWSTNPGPTLTDSITSDGALTSTYECTLTGLKEGTKYYVRAYATNSEGTGYGKDTSFTTLKKGILFNPDLIYGTVTDIDGNIYKTIEIGTQTWMAENLRTTKFVNGDIIQTTNTPSLNIEEEDNPKYQWSYNGEDNNILAYGRLYTWYVIIDNRGICPTGWHVPSNSDWSALINYLGGLNVAGGNLKETGTEHWKNPNVATNESGFSALAGGRRRAFDFIQIRDKGFWWTSSEYTIYHGSTYFITYEYSWISENFDEKYFGLSVRCIKD